MSLLALNKHVHKEKSISIFNSYTLHYEIHGNNGNLKESGKLKQVQIFQFS